jgi:hypothetical protein
MLDQKVGSIESGRGRNAKHAAEKTKIPGRSRGAIN